MENLNEFLKGVSTALLVISLILALAQGLFGYRLLKFWIALSGFAAGAVIGGYFSGMFTQEAGVQAIAAIVVGILLSILAFRVFLLGVFLFCGFLGTSAVLQLPVLQEHLNETLLLILALLAGIALGNLAVKFVRPTVIAVSSITAAGQLAGKLPGLWTQMGELPELFAGSEGRQRMFLVMAAFFILFQFLTTKSGASQK